MYLSFDSIDDFKTHYNNPTSYVNGKCKCAGIRELELINSEVNIGNYQIRIIDCPILKCQTCGDEQLGHLIPQEIYTTYYHMEERNFTGCKLTALNKERFSYAEKADYKYDCRDMNIPGLGFDADPTNAKGFSCPVFFDRKVLNNFFFDNDYELDMFSESYGTIAKKGTDGWAYEWNIVFGINRSNKVILFLGDLAQIDDDDRAVYWLKSYNIESDHCVIDTELYQAQLNCIFSRPILEKRIIKLRNSFFQKIKDKYGVELFHLEAEVENLGDRIRKPINYSETELRENVIALDGLLNEGIDGDGLRKLYEKLINPLPSDYKSIKTQTRKLLQGIIATVEGDVNAANIVAPLYTINDLRICFAHLLPQENIDARKNNVLQTLGISLFEDYRKLYDTMIDRLYRLYQYLNLVEL